MSVVERPGEITYFCKYPTKFALVDQNGETGENLANFNPKLFYIPTYQRKIVWGKKEIEDFIRSDAVLFGVVIFANEGNKTPHVLLDGLQRFATATALLHIIYPMVLAAKPNKIDKAKMYEKLKIEIQSHQPIIDSNHKAMSNYVRTGIAVSYKKFYRNIKVYVESMIDNDELDPYDSEKRTKAVRFASDIIKTFVDKQIAIDTYFDFGSSNELIQTFIHMNSTGLDLTNVDLLRSKIIEQAEKLEWNANEINRMENDFTVAFDINKHKGVDVLGKHLYVAISKESKPELVFKEWNELRPEHVNKLFDFINNFYESTNEIDIDKSELNKSNLDQKMKYPYLYEIKQCGRLPVAFTLWYFYKYVYLQNEQLDFLGGDEDTSGDVHILLRAYYRRLIDGTVGRIDSEFREFTLSDEIDMNASDVAKLIIKRISANNIDESPDETWLKSNLDGIGKNIARQVFNACLLPNRHEVGEKFEPKVFGTRKNQWHVDHMIPTNGEENNADEGRNMNTLRNFAPIPAPLNTSLKNAECRSKFLDGSTSYYQEREKHPYIKWLVTEHNDKYKDKKDGEVHPFNNSKFLAIKANFGIGDDRINEICDLLKYKL